jgi:transcriptional regulator with GAF, ATPase, and Fis domain/Flp pilus assembly protein TadD
MEMITIENLNTEAELLRRTNPDKCIELSEEALKQAMGKKHLIEQSRALHNVGEAYLWKSEFDKAFEFCFGALKIYNSLNHHSGLGAVYYTLGTIFFYLSDYDNALEEYMKSYRNYDLAQNELGVAESMNGIGSVYYAIDENKKAIQYLSRSLESCEILKNEGLKQKVLDGLGKAHKHLGDYAKALEYLNQCIGLIETTNGSSHVKAHALNNIGDVYYKNNDFSQALSFFEKSFALRKDTGFLTGQAESLNNIAKTYIAQRKYDQAEIQLLQALQIAKRTKSMEVESEAYRLLGELAENKRDFKTALTYQKKHFVKDRLIRNENNDRRAKSIQLRFKVEQEEKERELLKNKNKSLKIYSQNLVKLGEIGKILMSTHKLDEIISKTYTHVNELMDAPSIGLGIYDNVKEELFFPGYIENGKILDGNIYKLEEDRLAAVCCRENRTIVIGNINKEHKKWLKNFQPPKVGAFTLSVIYLPFEVPNGTRGVITVQSFNENEYNDHHVNMIRNLSVYIAIAIQNAMQYQELEEKVNERTQEIVAQKNQVEESYRVTALLNEVGSQLTSSTDFQSIFLKLHENVSQLMDATCFGVRLFNEKKNQVEYIFEIEKGEVDPEPIYVPMSEDDNYSVWCIKNNDVVFINDNKKEYKKYTKKIVVPSGEMPDSLIFYPIRYADRVIGLITVQSFEKNAYTERHVDVLKTLAAFTAVALENVSLVENLEEKVAKRTAEVEKQKAALEKMFEHTKLLNEIGRELTSTLSIKDVIEKVYININKLMDAAIIGIGIVNGDRLEIRGAMEKGEKLPDFHYDLSNENTLAIQCLKNKKEIFIQDLKKEIHNYVESDSGTVLGEEPESLLYIPLLVKEKAIGTISVQSFQRNAYNDYHINILRNLALYASTAIENANLYEHMEEEVKQRTKEVVAQKEEIETTYNNTKILGHIGQQIISTHDLENIFDTLHQRVNELMDATIFSIRLCDYEKYEIDYKFTIESGRRLGDIKVSLDDIDNYSVWCAVNKKDIFITDHAKDYKKYTKKIVVVDGGLPDSLIFCPMMIGDKVIGVITAQSFEKHAYKEYHLDILRTLAAYTAIAIENANLILNMEDQVRSRTAEVVRQKEIIEEKNKDITDSIHYAQRIQNVILPPLGDFNQRFFESFVLFKPRDIVSGDFYWIEEVDDKIYFAVVDCTGHGVPGALVSVVGANGLNRCLVEFDLRSPAEILDKLSEIVKETFAKTDSNVKDGMDMALCCIDKNSNTLKFAGAHNPLWLVRNDKDGIDFGVNTNVLKSPRGKNVLIEFKSDKKPIGYTYNEEPFSEVTIKLQKGDMIYLFSDGYADQFGGYEQEIINKGGKKFKTTNFKKLVLSIANKDLTEQQMILDETFEMWKGSLKQLDDVCVMGVKL